MKHFSLGQQRILFIFAILILAILYFRFYRHPLSPPEEEIYKEIVVEVLGEVRNPGIHLFQNPPTVREAIEKAGGLKEAALFDTDSFSETLETGTLLTIHPSPLPHGEREQGEGPLLKEGMKGIKQEEIKIKLGRMEARKLLVFSIPLDLNRVSAEDLSLIPGIGESLAQEILAYREKRRGFRSVEELKNVKGVGEKKLRTFKPFFFVEE
jgi:competence protein ComEA